MFQTMPSMPVLALVMPAVSGCITRELPGWSVALCVPRPVVRTPVSTLRCEPRNQKDRARHSTTKDPAPKQGETAQAFRIVSSPRHASCTHVDSKRPSHGTGFESRLSTTIDRGSPDWADDPLYSRQTLTGDGHE